MLCHACAKSALGLARANSSQITLAFSLANFASPLRFLLCLPPQIVWAVKDNAIGSAFFDAVAGKFFMPKLTQTSDKSANKPSERLKYTVDPKAAGSSSHKGLGSSLGPDWLATLGLTGGSGGDQPGKKVVVEFGTEVKAVFRRDELPNEKREAIVDAPLDAQPDWPVFVELRNGKVFGCDFIVSATGVTPNTELFAETPIAIAPDGGLKVCTAISRVNCA